MKFKLLLVAASFTLSGSMIAGDGPVGGAGSDVIIVVKSESEIALADVLSKLTEDQKAELSEKHKEFLLHNYRQGRAQARPSWLVPMSNDLLAKLSIEMNDRGVTAASVVAAAPVVPVSTVVEPSNSGSFGVLSGLVARLKNINFFK